MGTEGACSQLFCATKLSGEVNLKNGEVIPGVRGTWKGLAVRLDKQFADWAGLGEFY
jgi:hypothetical protein